MKTGEPSAECNPDNTAPEDRQAHGIRGAWEAPRQQTSVWLSGRGGERPQGERGREGEDERTPKRVVSSSPSLSRIWALRWEKEATLATLPACCCSFLLMKQHNVLSCRIFTRKQTPGGISACLSAGVSWCQSSAGTQCKFRDHCLAEATQSAKGRGGRDPCW